ncbi:restriction endonuclease subunit S [Streptococcus thermophilus]|uniref:restriction endonuclease subunit S n=1 Tax=Streptococcus thermophilus TaxID=1308 RepID=UPI00321A36C6
MKEKYCKIPKFRFNKFLESWKRLKYEDVIEVNSGKDYKHLEKGDIPVYGTGGYMLSVSEAITNKDGVGIGRKGTINKPYILKAPYWTVDTLFFCIPKNKYNLYFINAIFERTQWERFDESTGVPSLSKLTINNIQNYFPSFDEQSAIGSLFRTLDDLLSSYKNNLANYQSLKTTMLSKMFPKAGQSVPEIRLDGFEGEWKFIRLGKVLLEAYQGINTTSDKVEYSVSGIPILQAKHITNGQINYKDTRYLDMDIYEHYISKYMPKKGEILFANIGTIGPSVLVDTDEMFLIAWNILKMSIKDNYSPVFIKITLSLLDSKHIFERITTGNATKFINKDEIMDIRISVPSLPEQQAIGTYFSNLDNLINSYQEKISQLETLKKKLLQDMFI